MATCSCFVFDPFPARCSYFLLKYKISFFFHFLFFLWHCVLYCWVSFVNILSTPSFPFFIYIGEMKVLNIGWKNEGELLVFLAPLWDDAWMQSPGLVLRELWTIKLLPTALPLSLPPEQSHLYLPWGSWSFWYTHSSPKRIKITCKTMTRNFLLEKKHLCLFRTLYVFIKCPE